MVRPADPPPEGYGLTPLARYVVERLPEGYMIMPDDTRWLDFFDDHLQGEPTNESVLEATKRAVEFHSGRLHCDPFELLVDAGICTSRLEILP